MKDSQDIATLMEVEVAYGDKVPEILVMYKPCNWSLRQKKKKDMNGRQVKVLSLEQVYLRLPIFYYLYLLKIFVDDAQ